jgi:hypothetical protein
MGKSRAVNFKPRRKTAWSLRHSKAGTSQMLYPGDVTQMGPRAIGWAYVEAELDGELKELRQFGDDD